MPAIQITALNDPVALVHIPVELAPTYSTKLYWTIDQAPFASAEFFNVTSNRLEIAVFASTELVSDEWGATEHPDVRISASWRVFEISSGDEDEGGNYDSPHLRHVSTPLARAGISILYQSSYFTDFLLVKDSDFEKASGIFADQGWHVDPTSSHPSRRRSQLLTPLTPSNPLHSARASPPPPPIPELTVLSPALACVGFSRSAEVRSGERIRKFIVWPERSRASWASEKDHGRADTPTSSASRERGEDEVMRRGEGERPFLSYTRTEDGASLLTELRVLRGMFRGEEGDLQSGGELGWRVDSDGESDGGSSSSSESENEYYPLQQRAYAPQNGSSKFASNGQTPTPPPEDPLSSPRSAISHRKALSLPSTPGLEELGTLGLGDVPICWSGRGRRKSGGREKGRAMGKMCLQLDLRGVGEDDDQPGGAYHLDKSGLVTRFSTLLQSGNIRMLYSSTFHTANILVEAQDVRRAKRLLQKRRSGEWAT